MSVEVRALTIARNMWRELQRIAGVGEYNGRPMSERTRNIIMREAPQVVPALDATIRSYVDAQRLGVRVPAGTGENALRAALRALARVQAIMVGEVYEELTKPGLEQLWDILPDTVRERLRSDFPDFVFGTGIGAGLIAGAVLVGLWLWSKRGGG